MHVSPSVTIQCAGRSFVLIVKLRNVSQGLRLVIGTLSVFYLTKWWAYRRIAYHTRANRI